MAKITSQSTYDKQVLGQIASFLMETRATLSVAESVTSGCLQTALSLAEGATAFFQGGVTVYHGNQKTRLLNVEPIYGSENEYVNYQVAREMALGVNKLFLSEYSIAITGFAQPIPDHEFVKPYAYYAIARRETVLLEGFLETREEDSHSVQENFTQQLLRIFNDIIRK